MPKMFLGMAIHQGYPNRVKKTCIFSIYEYKCHPKSITENIHEIIIW